MNEKKKLLFGVALTITAFFFTSTTNALVKLLNNKIPVFQILFLQNLFGFAIMSTVCLYNNRSRSFYKSEHYGLLFWRSLGGLGTFLFIFISVKYVSVTNATLLFNTAPLFIPFMLLLCYKEKINHYLWLGILPGFIGIGIILDPGSNLFQWHALPALFSGISMATLFIVLRQLHFYKESMLRVLLYLFLCASLVALPMAAYDWKHPTSHEWIFLTLIGLFSFFSQSFITLSLRYGSPGALAPLCYSSVIFALFYDWVIWKVIPSWFSFLGILLVIAGGIAAIFIEARSQKLKR